MRRASIVLLVGVALSGIFRLGIAAGHGQLVASDRHPHHHLHVVYGADMGEDGRTV
jgi:hypothetical protein